MYNTPRGLYFVLMSHYLLPFIHQCHVTVQSLSVSLYNRLTKLFWRNLYWKYWNYVLGNENIKRNSRYTIRKNDSLCLRCLHWCFSVFSGVHVTQSLVFYVMFCRSLFVLFPFFWPLCCLVLLWFRDTDYPFGHSLSRVVVPATLHNISVNAHFTRFL